MRTKDRLAEMLDSEGLADIATRAREGLYDAYESPYSLPKFELVKALRLEDRQDLADRVMLGEFDNTEEDYQEWARSPQGQAALTRLVTR